MWTILFTWACCAVSLCVSWWSGSLMWFYFLLISTDYCISWWFSVWVSVATAFVLSPPLPFLFLFSPSCSLVCQIEMAIETLQKSEGLSSQRSSLLNSHVSHKNMTAKPCFLHCPLRNLFLRSVCFSLFRWWGLGSFLAFVLTPFRGCPLYPS